MELVNRNPKWSKDPDAVLPFYFIFHDSYLGETDTISSATVTSETGLTVDSSNVNVGTHRVVYPDGSYEDFRAGTVVTAWLSGGTAGTTYDVTCRITTSDGITDDRTKAVMVEAK